MKKNPFKKQGVIDTLTNTAIGGVGNVAFNYIWDMLGTTVTGIDDTMKNAIKLIGGAVAGSMTTNKYLRAMTDGFAVVGASELVSGLLITDNKDPKEDEKDLKDPNAPSNTDPKVTGLPFGTIGNIRRRYGSMNYAKKVRGTNGLEGFMD